MAATESTTAKRAADRRARLIRVARDLIAEEGVAACTFRRLATAAGSSTRPFTHAFGTRDALLRAVALTTWDQSSVNVNAPSEVVDRPVEWDCIDELIEIGLTWLPLSAEASRDERVYVEILLFSFTRPALREELLAFSYAANAHLAAIVAEGQRRGHVRTDITASDAVMSVLSLQEGLAITAVYEPDVLGAETVDRLWRDGVRRLLTPAQ